MIVKELTVEQIKNLCNSKTVAKVADTKYEEYKKEYITDEIPDGKYIAEDIGCVSINTVTSMKLNSTKLVKEHPELKELIEEYKEPSTYRTVKCESYALNPEDEPKKKILGLF